jgi:shikimate dehydrogenase
MLRLGLIGDNIAGSRAPTLHRVAGQLAGIDLAYERFVPHEMEADFDTVVERCREGGVHGLNITYPYKQRVMAHLTECSDLVRRIGSANTIVFTSAGTKGFNTDYTGFKAAYRSVYADMPPGVVAQLGAGGVGRAVAFGLVELGAGGLHLIDTDIGRAEDLAADLAEVYGDRTAISAHADTAACQGADAVVNCTPIGMVGLPGTPVPPERLKNIRWAFDAVYTPVETTFKADAEAAGAHVLSGFDLFFHQGVHAFEIFTGHEVTALDALSRALADDASKAA